MNWKSISTVQLIVEARVTRNMQFIRTKINWYDFKTLFTSDYMDPRSKYRIRYGRKKITFSGSVQLMVIAAAFHLLSFSVLFDFVRLIFRFICESRMHSRLDMHKHACLSGHQLWHIPSAYADVGLTINHFSILFTDLHVRVCARNICKNDKCVRKRSDCDST